jgi:AraC family transcriptional regulator
MSCIKFPEGPRIKRLEPEVYFSFTTRGISQGSFKDAAMDGFKKLQEFSKANNMLNKHTRIVGISPDDPAKTPKNDCRYICCMKFTDAAMKDLRETHDIKRYKLAGGDYAVFMHKGPHENIRFSWKWIVDQYMPNSQYDFSKVVPPFECYLNNPYTTSKDDLKTEIYVPILKKRTEIEYTE